MRVDSRSFSKAPAAITAMIATSSSTVSSAAPRSRGIEPPGVRRIARCRTEQHRAPGRAVVANEAQLDRVGQGARHWRHPNGRSTHPCTRSAAATSRTRASSAAGGSGAAPSTHRIGRRAPACPRSGDRRPSGHWPEARHRCCSSRAASAASSVPSRLPTKAGAPCRASSRAGRFTAWARSADRIDIVRRARQTSSSLAPVAALRANAERQERHARSGDHAEDQQRDHHLDEREAVPRRGGLTVASQRRAGGPSWHGRASRPVAVGDRHVDAARSAHRRCARTDSRSSAQSRSAVRLDPPVGTRPSGGGSRVRHRLDRDVARDHLRDKRRVERCAAPRIVAPSSRISASAARLNTASATMISISVKPRSA